jgi:hypothetical protein
MWKSVVPKGILVLIGLMLGVLLQARVFHPLRERRPVQSAQTSVPTLVSVQKPVLAPTDIGGTPQLVIDEPAYSFGNVEPSSGQDAKISHTFIVRNVGSAPLEISRVKPSCGCTTARLDQPTIPAGGSVNLDATLDLHNRPARKIKRFSCKPMIRSNRVPS